MEYHKIETLYERDEKTHRLKQPLILKNEVYGCLKSWQWTEKIDGTNIRVMWRPEVKLDQDSDEYPQKESLTFGGKTDNAQIHADLLMWLYENVSRDKLREIFPSAPVVIYGEGYGAGIQKGGDYSAAKKLIVFDVFVRDLANSVFGGWWLNWTSVCDVCSKLSLDTVPSLGERTLEDATEMVRVGFQSRLNGGKAKAEGLVGRPVEALFDKKGHRLITKLKTKDF